MLAKLNLDVAQAQDNLLLAKAQRSALSNHASPTSDDPGRRHSSKATRFGCRQCTADRSIKPKGRNAALSFPPRVDGPYEIVGAFHLTPSYRLNMGSFNVFPIFHISELLRYTGPANDDSLFPSRTLTRPGPIVTTDGAEVYRVDKVMDARRYRNTRKLLVR